MLRGARVGRVFGVGIHLDPSLVIIAFLIAASLGLGALPMWHPDWSAIVVWAVALVATAALLASVLAHELSHALVARAYGLPVNRITLFVFGGVADIEEEPPSPRVELMMAAAGPATSLVLGAVFWIAGAVGAAASDTSLLRDAGPVTTVLLWLGSSNVILGLFNLVPGFPLDGGRVLRAVLWWATASLHTATRIATGVGESFGWLLVASGLLMALGVHLPFFGTGVGGGIWIGFIGWFLKRAARESWNALVVHEALRDVPVRRLMRRRVLTVHPDLVVSALVNDYLMASEQSSFPVMLDGELVGLVGIPGIRTVPRDAWDSTPVRSIMTPAASLELVSPDASADEALQKLSSESVEVLPVIEDGGRLEGVLRRQDLARWLALFDRTGHERT